MSKLKPKILIIADDPRIPSGVGGMNAIICNHLAKSGFEIICMGGAIRHPNYDKVNFAPNITIIPVDVYGNPDILRNVMAIEKPDMIFIFTDPRYFEWVWMMEDEIRDKIPIFYYHVWDCDPIPKYNECWYRSCDHISCISKLTYDIVKSFGNIPCSYVPHGIDTNIFKPLEDRNIVETHKAKLIKNNYKYDDDTFFVLWNNRNIRRKIPAEVLNAFSQFNKIVPNSILIMHTNVIDGEGTDLYAVHEDLYPESKVVFTDFKIDQQGLNIIYNMADVVVNISFNEGFGLATIEAMGAGVPIIVNMTGGLQDQLELPNGEKCGIGMNPVSRTVVGSVPTPYIYDDRISTDQLVNALKEIYDLGKEGRKKLALNARKNAETAFSAKNMCEGIERDIRKCLHEFQPRKSWVCEEFRR